MLKKSAAALAVAGAITLVAPSVSTAGGEMQEYQQMSRTTTTTSGGAGSGAPAGGAGSGAPAAYSNYAPAPSYVRPMSSYYGSPYMGPCSTMPYGGGAGQGAACNPCAGGGGGGGGLFGNPVFTAGLLGLGLGYLIWH